MPPSRSLAVFPQVLDDDERELDWTQKLGDPSSRGGGTCSPPRSSLRAKAAAQGSLGLRAAERCVDDAGGRHHGDQDRPTNPEVVPCPPTTPPSCTALAVPRVPALSLPPGYVAGGALLGLTASVIVAALWGNVRLARRRRQRQRQPLRRFRPTNIMNGELDHNAQPSRGRPYRDKGVSGYRTAAADSDAASRDAFRGTRAGRDRVPSSAATFRATRATAVGAGRARRGDNRMATRGRHVDVAGGNHGGSPRRRHGGAGGSFTAAAQRHGSRRSTRRTHRRTTTATAARRAWTPARDRPATPGGAGAAPGLVGQTTGAWRRGSGRVGGGRR